MNNVDRDTLEKKYVIERKAIHIVAKEMGVATGTVYNYLKNTESKHEKKLTIQLQKSRGRHGEKSGRKKWDAD